MRLHAELQAQFDADTTFVPRLKLVDLRDVARVVDIREGYPLGLARTSRMVFDAERVIPVALDAVVDVVREADLVEALLDGVGHDVLHRVGGVVAVVRVHVVVGKHGSLPSSHRPSKPVNTSQRPRCGGPRSNAKRADNRPKPASGVRRTSSIRYAQRTRRAEET